MNLHRNHRGFSLVELMVALSAGLVISGAAVVLVSSIVKSNNETLRASRLTQELRATAEIIARDLMRARGVNDPIQNLNVATIGSCDTISPSTTTATSCLKFGFDCDSSTSGTFKAYGLASSKVRLVTSSTGTAACPTAATGTQITSAAVNITSLSFARVSNTNVDAYTISISGQLANSPTSTNGATVANPTRTYTETVRVRSPSVN
jgi:prepilin-type N-terminal cleavage/methylation domain-containing protein